MTVEVRLRSDAEQDITEATLWYEQQLPGLGHHFLDEILITIHSIAQSPLTKENSK